MISRTASALLLSLASVTAIGAEFNSVSFESSTVFYELDNELSGNGNTLYGGLWVDGGSDAYTSSTEAYSGDKAFVVDVIDSIEAKDNYGTLYSKTLDLSMTSKVTVNFNYLVTNTTSAGAITNPAGSFAFEVSGDDGETWTTVFENTNLSSIKSTIRQWSLDNGCGTLDKGEALEACIDELESTANISEEALKSYWFKSGTLTLPSAMMTKTTVLRLKSYLSSTHAKTKVYFDDLQVNYEGNKPTFSADSLVPTTDNISNSRVQYDYASFDTDDDWGVWQDGGRNVYTSGFLAEDVNGVVLRYQYVEGEANEPDPDTGEDTGEHKPTYSSIYTKNLDMTEVEHLEVSFSFVGYNMSIAKEDSFTLSLSTNSGIDFTEIETWRVGEDFINLQRYNVNVNIPGYLTSTSKLTTTTILKIQSSNATADNQLYIDNLNFYTIGTKSSPAGTPLKFNWSKFNQTILQADAAQSTYDLINNTLIREEYTADKSWEGNNPETDSDDVKKFPGIYGAVEHSDCTYQAFGEHITQKYDPQLERDVFVFNIHQHLNEAGAYATPDTDRCRTDGLYDDRQRVEIKTYSQSKDHQKAQQNETFYFAWRLKIPDGFQGSDKFTHLHQLKPVGGDYASMPLITLTAVGADYDYDSGSAVLSSPAQLNLRYSPTAASQVTITSADISKMEGKWVQVLEKVKFGTENQGRYEIIITDPDDLEAEPYLAFTSYSLPMWKDGGEFIRPKWGIYRSIVQGNKLRDEQIKFSDFVMLENSDGSAKEGDLLDFGEYVQGLENQTYVSNANYYDGLLSSINASAADDDTISINTDENTLSICSIDEVSKHELCRSVIDLDSLVNFEGAFACYQNSNATGCLQNQQHYLDLINTYIEKEPASYGLYALWRIGGKEISGLDAYYGYFYVIEYQMTEEGSVLASFAYVGGDLFTFPDATPALNWKASAIAYYSDIQDCLTSFDVYCVGYGATEGYSSGNGDLDADAIMFRESMAAGYYEIPSSAVTLLEIIDELGDYKEITQAVDSLSAAYYMKDHWGEYHEGKTVNFEEVQMALGYVENTKGVPLVTDNLLRYALAYMLFNDAFFNAIDTGTGSEADNKIDNDDVKTFISQFIDDVDVAIDWYNQQNNNDKYNTFKNKYIALIMANKEVFEAITSRDDGQIELEDLQFYSEHESEHLSLLSEAVKLIAYNRAIFYRLDTGANVFNWDNYPNGKISLDNMLSASEYIDFSPEGLLSNLYQSLLLKTYEGDYSVNDNIRLKAGNMLMVWDATELLASDPGNVFKADAIQHLEDMLDIANNAALDNDTSTWLSENLTTELDQWMPEGSVIRTTFKAYLTNDLGYYAGGATEEFALELLASNNNDLEAAITAMQEHLEPLKLFSEYEERYDDLVQEILLIMLEQVEGEVVISPEIEAAVIAEAISYLPDDTIETDGYEVAEANVIAGYTAIRALIWQGKNVSKILDSIDSLETAVKDKGYFTSYTSEQWVDYYKKGYVHAARAASTAAVLIAKIAAADDLNSEEFYITMATTSYSLAGDLVSGSERYLKVTKAVAEEKVKTLQAIYDSIPDTFDAGDLRLVAAVEDQLEYFKSIQKTAQSRTVAIGKVANVFAVSDTIVGGYYTYVSITSSIDAFEDKNYLLGTIYVIEAAANGVGAVSAVVEAAVLFGYMSNYAATAGVFGGASAAVAATVGLGLLSYEAHQAISYKYSLAEFRGEAEQVFRPNIVNDENVTSWTEEEVSEWYCTRFIEHYNLCGWDDDDGSEDLDWIFNVGTTSDIADSGNFD